MKTTRTKYPITLLLPLFHSGNKKKTHTTSDVVMPQEVRVLLPPFCAEVAAVLVNQKLFKTGG